MTMRWVRVARPGRKLGRKPSPDSGVSHATRDELPKGTPTHISFKWLEGLPNLRDDRVFAVLDGCIRGANERGLVHVVEFSVQANHLHAICEASDRHELARGIQGLKVRMARALNKFWQRTGQVFADRYHRQDLRTPRQVRNCIRYVLQNIFRHRCECDVPNRDRPDRYSSGRWFTGWRGEGIRASEAQLDGSPVARPTTWLLRVGWKRAGGLLSIHERPAGAT